MNTKANNTSQFKQLFKVKTGANLKLNTKQTDNKFHSADYQSKIYFSSLKALLDKNDFENFFGSLEIYIPQIQDKYPGLLLSVYQCWLLLYKAMEMTVEYETVFAKYIIPLCLQYPNQMHTLKTKQLYSYLGNINMIIKDNSTFKMLVEQFVDRVLLLVNSLILDISHSNTNNCQSKIDFELLVLAQIENRIVELFQINNPIEYFLNRKTASSSFESDYFTSSQDNSINNPLINLTEIKSNNSDKTQVLTHTNRNPITYRNDPHSNYNIYSKHSLQKKEKKTNTIRCENPFLKDFNPRFLKKENIDKKILRRFRAYIKEINQKDPNFLSNYEKTFWNDFSDIQLLPPMIYTESSDKVVEFKSFNTKYLFWLFSKNGAYELFNTFAQEQGKDFLNSLIETYSSKISKEKGMAEKLKNYFYQIPMLYSQSKPSASTSVCCDESTLTNCIERKTSEELLAHKEEKCCNEHNDVFALAFFDNTHCSESPQRNNMYRETYYNSSENDFLMENDNVMWMADKILENDIECENDNECIPHANCY